MHLTTNFTERDFFSPEYESRVFKRPVNTLLTPTRSLITRKRELFRLLSHWYVFVTYDFHWTTRANKNFVMLCVLWHMNTPLVCSTSYACFKKEKRPIWTWTRLHRQHLFQLFFEATQLNTYPCFFSPRNYQTCFGAVAKKYLRASSLPPQVHYGKLLGNNGRFGSYHVYSLLTNFEIFFFFVHIVIINSQK